MFKSKIGDAIDSANISTLTKLIASATADTVVDGIIDPMATSAYKDITLAEEMENNGGLKNILYKFGGGIASSTVSEGLSKVSDKCASALAKPFEADQLEALGEDLKNL